MDGTDLTNFTVPRHWLVPATCPPIAGFDSGEPSFVDHPRELAIRQALFRDVLKTRPQT